MNPSIFSKADGVFHRNNLGWIRGIPGHPRREHWEVIIEFMRFRRALRYDPFKADTGPFLMIRPFLWKSFTFVL